MRVQPLAKSRDLDIDIMMRSACQASAFLKALSHEARLVILCLLVEGEKSVSEIEQTLGLRQPSVSQQLARLRAEGFVETRRNGKNVYYSLAWPEVRDIIMALHAGFCQSAPDRPIAAGTGANTRANGVQHVDPRAAFPLFFNLASCRGPAD